MKILDILREIANQCELPFGHGMRSYANLQKRSGIYEREKNFPRAYVYPINMKDELRGGGLFTTHEVFMDILDVCSLSASESDLEMIMQKMYERSGTFLRKIANHKDVMAIENVQREPNYHVFDANLCGWVLRFDVRILEPQPPC